MLQIIDKALDSLIPSARNARTHDDEQVAQIAGSIREFGFTNPILLDKANGIIAGHGRVLAARKLAMDSVPCIELSNLTEAQVRALMIADNKLALNAGWDEALLTSELKELKQLDIDLALMGFSEDEFADLLETVDEAIGKSALLEMIDTTIAEPRHEVIAGDVWRIGPHWLFCVSVVSGWHHWAPKLDHEDTLFVPYPGPYVPLGNKATGQTLVMVQPSTYIAGHLLDRYEDVNGSDGIEKLS